VIDLRRRLAPLAADVPGPAPWAHATIGAAAPARLDRPGFRTGLAAAAGGIAASIAMLVTVMVATGGQNAAAPPHLAAAPPAAPAAVPLTQVPLAHAPSAVHHVRPAHHLVAARLQPPAPAGAAAAGGASAQAAGSAAGRQQLSAPAPSPQPSTWSISWPASSSGSGSSSGMGSLIQAWRQYESSRSGDSWSYRGR
jgi:hypothetical protein